MQARTMQTLRLIPPESSRTGLSSSSEDRSFRSSCFAEAVEILRLTMAVLTAAEHSSQSLSS